MITVHKNTISAVVGSLAGGEIVVLDGAVYVVSPSEPVDNAALVLLAHIIDPPHRTAEALGETRYLPRSTRVYHYPNPELRLSP